MNFIELAIVIAERGEKVLEERAKVIRTDKHTYVRKDNGQWEEIITTTTLIIAPYPMNLSSFYTNQIVPQLNKHDNSHT